jgi:hypothetical protein
LDENFHFCCIDLCFSLSDDYANRMLRLSDDYLALLIKFDLHVDEFLGTCAFIRDSNGLTVREHVQAVQPLCRSMYAALTYQPARNIDSSTWMDAVHEPALARACCFQLAHTTASQARAAARVQTREEAITTLHLSVSSIDISSKSKGSRRLARVRIHVFTNRERCEVELKGYKKKNLVERLVRSIYGPAGLVSELFSGRLLQCQFSLLKKKMLPFSGGMLLSSLLARGIGIRLSARLRSIH